VNIHTKLVGAIDAIILSSLVTMTVVMMYALLNPTVNGDSVETMGKRATVTIEQIA